MAHSGERIPGAGEACGRPRSRRVAAGAPRVPDVPSKESFYC